MTRLPTIPEPVSEAELDRATDPEYAAVSTAAVVGVIFGVLGFSAFVAAPFVGLSVLGAVLGIAALRKIRRSRGVLVGRKLAIAAISLGAATAALGGGYHAAVWLDARQTLQDLERRALDVTDALVAGRYDDVFAQLPEDFRRREKGPEEFRRRFVPLFEGAGKLVGHKLLSLQILATEKGETVAPADVRVELEQRVLELNLWFRLDDDGAWHLVGIGGQETLESAARHHPEKAPTAIPGPYQRR